MKRSGLGSMRNTLARGVTVHELCQPGNGREEQLKASAIYEGF